MVNGLYIIHVNIRSLFHKMDELRAWLTYNKPNIITVSETWLSSQNSDTDISLENYTLFRADRCSGGGGVITYISSNLQSYLLLPKEKPVNFDGLLVKVILH